MARELAPNIAQIQIVTSGGELGVSQTQSTQSRDTRNGADSGRSAAPSTLRQFARSLSLGNASERIAAIAYYVNKVEGKQAFSPKEMDGWFTMCGFQKPSQIAVALFDSKRKYGYLENIGRAMWRISNQGENLILAKLEEGKD